MKDSMCEATFCDFLRLRNMAVGAEYELAMGSREGSGVWSVWVWY